MTRSDSRRRGFARAVLPLLLLGLTLPLSAAPELPGVWELEHTFSQKISVGLVSDLYPSTAEWSPDLLITGVQFLNERMAFLHCSTPSGSTSVDYKALYAVEERGSRKSAVRFTLEDGQEILLALFEQEDGPIVFSYCDAGPSPGERTTLGSSTNKIVFRNHLGLLKRLSE